MAALGVAWRFVETTPASKLKGRDNIQLGISSRQQIGCAGLAAIKHRQQVLPARCDRFVAASDAALEAPCAGAGGFDMVWLSSGKQLRETFHWQIPSAIYDMWPVELCPADERLLALAERVHGELAEKAPKANACEELLRGLVSEESLLACCWLAEMRKKQVPLDASSLEAVVRGLGGNGLASQAEAVLEAWSKELLAVGEAAPSNCLVVQAFARRGDLAKAQAWLDRMDAAEIPIDAPTYAAAIEALAQGGPAEPARRLLDSAMGRAVELGEPTFTAVIAAFAKDRPSSRKRKLSCKPCATEMWCLGQRLGAGC
ncbi:unnamed protein product [Effrenium voratum]|nr:unnamed protein product [Effrenium voratum]